MSDTSSFPSAIGIEAVECESDAAGAVTVRVTGRWRRRRPEWRGPAVLVLEGRAGRQRVPAMPEPPSLSGTLPGTWRMSFSVPAELASQLEGRSWLQLGAMMAPLDLPAPHGVAPPPALAPPPAVAPPRAGTASVGYERAPAAPAGPTGASGGYEPPPPEPARAGVGGAGHERAPSEPPEARLLMRLRAEVERLVGEVEELQRQPEQMRVAVVERERELREARQRLHAEIAVREELEDRLLEQERTTVKLRERTRVLADHEHELEREIRHMRRAVDEAEHEAAAARAASARAAAPSAPTAAPAAEPAAPLAVEPSPVPPTAAPPPGVAAPPSTATMSPAPAVSGPPAAATARESVAPLLAAELAAVDRASQGDSRRTPTAGALEREAALLARFAAGVRTDRERIVELDQRIAVLERELEQARDALSDELAARRAAEDRVSRLAADLERQRERSVRALEAIVEVRAELSELRRQGAGPSEEEPPRAASMESERLRAALERLRAQHAPASDQPENDLQSGEGSAPGEESVAAAQPTVTAVPPGAPQPTATAVPPAAPQRPATAEPPAIAEPPAVAMAPTAAEPPAIGAVPTAPAGVQPAGAAPGPPPPSASEAPSPWAEVVAATEQARQVPAPLAPAPAQTWSRQPEGPDALPRLFKSLVRENPAAAGRLVLGLLPAQRLVYPRRIAYDIILAPSACVQVTVGTESTRVELADGPRDRDEVQLRVSGDAAALARLLAAGPIGRRLRRGVARARGERSALQALRKLRRARLHPRELQAVGATLEPALTLRFAALLLDAEVTDREQFTLAHRPAPHAASTATLHLGPGGPPTVVEIPLEATATTTIVCAPEALLGALLGERSAGVTIIGDERPLSLVSRSLQHA